MKATGVVRKIDELGRVVIPIEVRRNFGIAEKDGLEIFIDDESIILKKYQPACNFCDSMDELRMYKGKRICGKCIEEITTF